MLILIRFTLFILLFSCNTAIVLAGSAKGIVYLDANKNGFLDINEKGVEGVCISNGKDVIRTNSKGEWELEVEENSPVFVIKPAGYSVPLSKNFIPQYFSGKNNLSSQSINFSLIPEKENKKFSVLFFGDTQARGMKEVNYIFHDVVEELIGNEAAFGVSLGDIVADDPEMMDDVAAGIAQIGIPWYNIFGNHDNDRAAKTNLERDDTFEKFFGPSTYAFEYSEVAFIGLNNIFFNSEGKYKPHFTEEQLAFVENYLTFVPENKLVVLMMHAPIIASDNKEEMFRLLEKRQYTFSVSGHVHEQINLFVDEKMGWQGSIPHHHLINATVCGSWWCGLNDELGIPHATMNDGAPNGYSKITFDGNSYEVQFKAARRPENYQMNIYLPNELNSAALDTTAVLVNIFAGSERSIVEMKINNGGEWIPMDTIKTVDPECLRMFKLNTYLDETVNEIVLEDVLGYKMDYPSISHHMWIAKLPENIKPGTHTITIRTTDMYNKTWQAHRIFRVSDAENQ